MNPRATCVRAEGFKSEFNFMKLRISGQQEPAATGGSQI